LFTRWALELNYRNIKLETLHIYIAALSVAFLEEGTGNVEVALADVDDKIC